MSEPRVVVLGAGPAGVGAAYQLRCQGKAAVTVLERNDAVGGNAGSFEWEGQRLDFGSHRLHPACEPEILDDIRALLGDDLRDRPRHGRIRLLGRWIHFPLKPLDLLLRLDPRFAAGTLKDAVIKPSTNGEDTFAAVLWSNLGPTICKHFYFPYARKIWGFEPEELSGIQARRRVAAGSFGKLVRKVMNAVPGFKPAGAGRFFYPRAGFGQISDAYADAARAAGADLRLGCNVTRAERMEGGWRVHFDQDGEAHAVEADHLWSTIPVTVLARLLDPPAPPELLTATQDLQYRAMLLVYLRLPVPRFTEYDAHYFPEQATIMTRMSEPKNYVGEGWPAEFTTLCAELPCAAYDTTWSKPDDELGRLVARDLENAGIPLPVAPSMVHVRRLSHAYPVYLNGYEGPFEQLDRWLSEVPRLLSYGRQGLFAHDNTHHALAMAYAAVSCLSGGTFDGDRWAEHRDVFRTHVVED